MEKLLEVKPPALSRCCRILTQHPREVEHGLMPPAARPSVPRGWRQRWHGQPGTREEPKTSGRGRSAPPGRAAVPVTGFVAPSSVCQANCTAGSRGGQRLAPGGSRSFGSRCPQGRDVAAKADGLHLLSHWEKHRCEGGVWVGISPRCPSVHGGSSAEITKASVPKALWGLVWKGKPFPR